MNKKNGTDSNFQEKFKDRMENIGKDGVFGIVRKTENPINISDNPIGEWNNLYNNNIVNKIKIENNKSPTKKMGDKVKIDQSQSINKSKMSNNGNMIISNNPYTNAIHNPMNNMMNMNMPMIGGGMGNPYYMAPYVGYPQLMQPMLNYNNYGNSPMYYNPYQMSNNIPLNNYNRNLGGNMNMNYNNNNNLPFLGFNSNCNAPIKLIGNNPRNIENITDQRIQRSISSKGARDNSKINNQFINNEISYRGDGPSTNPESFSRKRGYSSNSNSNANYDSGYKPYSLKDYKDITAAKLVLGGLGPNIGTQEWMEKQEKMKKMEVYAKNVKGKPIINFVKETPIENSEKIKKEKIETSNRFKSYEYAKLIRQKPKSSIESNVNYLNTDMVNKLEMDNTDIKIEEPGNNYGIKIQNLNRIDLKNKHNSNINKIYNEQNSNRRYKEENSNTKEFILDRNSNNYNSSREDLYNKSSQHNNNTEDDLEFLKIQKQREVLNLKLNEIKESLLK